MKKRMHLPFLFVAVLFCTSCHEKFFTADVDCDECYTESLDEYDLTIELTMDNRFQGIPIVVYEGDFEDNKVVYVDTAFSSPYKVLVQVDKKYSVRAEYKSKGKLIYAVDGTKLKSLLVSDACDEECYVVENDKLDVRLKYAFP